MPSAPYLSLILPVYNEAARLPETLQTLETFCGTLPFSWEVVCVDDGSQDGSQELLKAAATTFPLTLLSQAKNEGKGWAVRRGMLESKGNYRVFIDADLATPPSEILKLVEALKLGADVAIGSRIQSDGTDLRLVGGKPQPPLRRILGKIFRLVATRPFLGRIRDSQCGAKAFTAASALTLFSQQHIKRWTFDIEILFLARRAKLKVVEVPVLWAAQENSKLQPSISLAFTTVKELLAILWYHQKTAL